MNFYKKQQVVTIRTEQTQTADVRSEGTVRINDTDSVWRLKSAEIFCFKLSVFLPSCEVNHSPTKQVIRSTINPEPETPAPFLSLFCEKWGKIEEEKQNESHA